MKSRTYIVLFILCIISGCTDTQKTDSLNKTISLPTDSIGKLKNKIDSLNKMTIDLESKLNSWFTEQEIDILRRKGIQNPEKEITDNLYKNTKLIPYSGVLGGKMRIGDVKLLGDRWAIAYFDDGHIDGEMLLRYKITKDSTIKWSVIDHYLK